MNVNTRAAGRVGNLFVRTSIQTMIAVTIDEGRYEGIIGQGGLMLCAYLKRPPEKEPSITGPGPANKWLLLIRI